MTIFSILKLFSKSALGAYIKEFNRYRSTLVCLKHGALCDRESDSKRRNKYRRADLIVIKFVIFVLITQKKDDVKIIVWYREGQTESEGQPTSLLQSLNCDFWASVHPNMPYCSECSWLVVWRMESQTVSTRPWIVAEQQTQRIL